MSTDATITSGLSGQAGHVDVGGLASDDPLRLSRFARQGRAPLDAGLLIGTAVIATLLEPDRSWATAAWAALFVAAVLVRMYARGAYARKLRLDFLEDVKDIVYSTLTAATVVLALQLLVSGSVPLAPIERIWAFATVYLIAGRLAVRIASGGASHRAAQAPTLIVGAGRVGTVVAERLLAQPDLGLRPIGFLDKEPLELGGARLPLLGASWDLEDVIREHDVRYVVLAFSTAPASVMLDLARRCEALGVTVASVPRLFEAVNGRLTLEHLGGIPLMMAESADPRGWQFAIKYLLDRLVAIALIILLLPAFLAIALLVRRLVGKPVLFRQVRIGRDGREFEMLKFRSMRGEATPADATGEGGVEFGPGGVEGADRRTPFGSLLRRTGLDELPQLINVAKGEMSIVGPRPERPSFVEVFEQNVYRYADRHRVKSGITGWAQIHGLRGKTSLSDRVEWDNYYIENWSLWLDLKILLSTASAVARSRNAVE